MRSRPPSFGVSFARPLVSLLAGVLVLALSSRVQAESAPPVLIWGIARGCTALPDVDRDLEKALNGPGGGARLLQSPGGQSMSRCVAAECAQRLLAACPQVSKGLLVGGQVQTNRGVTQTRLWVHDMSTGQTAYADDYCESCGVQNAVNTHARNLLLRPRYGVEGPKGKGSPSYCVPENVGTQAASSVLLSVTGEGKGKAAVGAVQEAIRQQLTLRGHGLLPMPAEGRGVSLSELQRQVEGQAGGQLLWIQLGRDGHGPVQVKLFDQRTGLGTQKMVSCGDCGGDREVLISRLKSEVAALLDDCYGASCGEGKNRPPGTQPSANACEPFASDGTCSESVERGESGAKGTPRAVGMDPRLARTIQGLTWGAVGATAAASVTLFALSGTGAGNLPGGAHHILDPAGWATTGVALGLTAFAIPITLLLNRAASTGRPGAASLPSNASSIQCPN